MECDGFAPILLAAVERDVVEEGLVGANCVGDGVELLLLKLVP